MSQKDKKASVRPKKDDVQSIVATLERMGSKKVRDGMARFAIPSDKAFGIPVGNLRAYAKRLGRNHELAAALWDAEWYEARMLACFLDDPEQVTPVQMDQWCRDFDNWAICDTACFHLFDKTPHSWRKIEQWAKKTGEFQKRAAFALLASVALHDKKATDEPFIESLHLTERASDDERNFVKKGVVWALRGIGSRNAALHAAAIAVAQRLSAANDPTPRWIGKTVLRELNSAASKKRIVRK